MIAATNLLKAILAKAGLEFLVIIAAVSIAAYTHLYPPMRGAIDIVEPSHVVGWAYDPRKPNDTLAVQLFVDGKFVTTVEAHDPRPDLVSAGATITPAHGFSFALPPLPSGTYKINAYAVHAGASQNQTLLSVSKKDHYLEIR